jgi:hypothetical protein
MICLILPPKIATIVGQRDFKLVRIPTPALQIDYQQRGVNRSTQNPNNMADQRRTLRQNANNSLTLV